MNEQNDEVSGMPVMPQVKMAEESAYRSEYTNYFHWLKIE